MDNEKEKGMTMHHIINEVPTDILYMIQELKDEFDKDFFVNRLMTKCKMNEKEATELVNLHWD